MTPEEVVQEEAKIGQELLSTLKQECINAYSWTDLTNIKNTLEGLGTDIEALRKIGVLWAGVVRRLHVKVYNNKEFEGTITERLEQVEKLLCSAPERSGEEKSFKKMLQREYGQLKKEINALSKEEKKDERRERDEKERIREERLFDYVAFREETYQLLAGREESGYDIDILDTQWQEANILEMIKLPKPSDRSRYRSIEVRLTPAQLEGYLFLAQLGEIGGDPLTRSILTSKGITNSLIY